MSSHAQPVAGARVLVTGGAGTIGSTSVDQRPAAAGRRSRRRPFRPSWVTERELDGPVADLRPPSRQGGPTGACGSWCACGAGRWGSSRCRSPRRASRARPSCTSLHRASGRRSCVIVRSRPDPPATGGPSSRWSCARMTGPSAFGRRCGRCSTRPTTPTRSSWSTTRPRRTSRARSSRRLPTRASATCSSPGPACRARATSGRAPRGARSSRTPTTTSRWIATGSPGSLTAFTRAPRVGVVTGLVPAAALETRSQAIFDTRIGWAEHLEPRLYDLGANDPGTRFFPYSAGVFGTGANCAFRAETLRGLGYFDERLGPGNGTLGGEDLDIFLRALRAGWTLAYEPAAVVWHFHRADEHALAYQLRAYGRGLGAYAAKHIAASDTRRRDRPAGPGGALASRDRAPLVGRRPDRPAEAPPVGAARCAARRRRIHPGPSGPAGRRGHPSRPIE